MKFQFSAGGIIYQEKQGEFYFALILDSYGKWTFPKGHIEKNEKPALAAKREVTEEIGINKLIDIKLLDKIDYWFRLEGELIHKFVYFYLMKAPPKTVLKPEISEIKTARWFSPKEALKVLGYKKDSQKLLKKAFSELKIML